MVTQLSHTSLANQAAHVKTCVVVIFLLILSQAWPASAANPITGARGEYGFLSGYGISHVGFGETRHQVQTFDTIVRAGFFLSEDIAKGSWYQGRHEVVLELPFHLAIDQGARPMAGLYVLGHWRFTGFGEIAPYVLAGGGPLYVDLGLASMGTKLCFSYQGGTGLQYFIDRKTALNMEYRYHHISNAGTAEPNEPINSSKILLGLSVYY